MSKQNSQPELAAGPVVCRPWCVDHDGHPNDTFAESQICMTAEVHIPLILNDDPADESADALVCVEERPDEPPTIDAVAGRMTRDEWNRYTTAGDALWALTDGAEA